MIDLRQILNQIWNIILSEWSHVWDLVRRSIMPLQKIYSLRSAGNKKYIGETIFRDFITKWVFFNDIGTGYLIGFIDWKLFDRIMNYITPKSIFSIPISICNGTASGDENFSYYFIKNAKSFRKLKVFLQLEKIFWNKNVRYVLFCEVLNFFFASVLDLCKYLLRTLLK